VNEGVVDLGAVGGERTHKKSTHTKASFKNSELGGTNRKKKSRLSTAKKTSKKRGCNEEKSQVN